MQGIVWNICPQDLGQERDHLIGIRHPKQVSFPEGGPIRYPIKAVMMSPTKNYEGKGINRLRPHGKMPMVAAGNAYSDFGMFHITDCGYTHLSLLLHHDDDERECVYLPTYDANICWKDALQHYH